MTKKFIGYHTAVNWPIPNNWYRIKAIINPIAEKERRDFY